MVTASSSPATTPISRSTRLSSRPSHRPPSLGQLHRPQLAISKQPPAPLSSQPQSSPAPLPSSAPPPAIPALPSLSNSQWRQTPSHSLPPSIPRPLPPPSASQRLEAVLEGMPHYLDQPGPQNRLILSIRSGLAEDVEYGLAVLLAASFYEPELVPLARFPGLLDALLELVELYASAGPFADPEAQSTRRHALEATQVLCNLATQDANAALLAASPRVLRCVCARLEQADPRLDPEILGLLLDLLESLATQTTVQLDQPLERPAPGAAAPKPAPPPGDAPDGFVEQAWSATLVDRLDALTEAADRALVLGAYRCFSALGLIPANQTYMAHRMLHRAAPDGWPCSLARALALLALPDVELLLSVLDYLYALTATGMVARALCTRQADLGALLRLLLVHSRHQLRVHADAPEPLAAPGPAWYFSRPAPPPAPRSPPAPTATIGGRTPQTQTMSEVNRILLSEHQLGELAGLAEPLRAHRWMSRVFEADSEAEVQQVTLWLAYKTQFEPHQNRPNGHPMIAPADAIKLTSDVFPNAVPSVNELPSGEKRFVIKGMRVRERQPYPPETYKCRWKSCTESTELVGPDALHAHLLGAHLSLASDEDEAEGSRCEWHTCTHVAASGRELGMHVRTHMPLGRARGAGRGGVTEPVAFRAYRHERWETPAGPEAELGPVGIGYVALLVVRNLARAVAAGVAGKAKTRGGMEGEWGGVLVEELGRLVAGAVQKEVVLWARKDRQLVVVSMEILGCVCAIEEALEGIEKAGGGAGVGGAGEV